MKWVLVVVALLLGVGSRPARADVAPETHLRVLTWNIWNLPVVTPSTEARARAVVPAVVAYDPDVVLLQEVWVPEHGELLLRAFAKAGYRYSRFRPDEDSGLLIASRYPITDRGFRPFSMGRTSLVPWHLDYVANKGVAIVRVQTPAGPVDVANTHLQASYHRGGYSTVRLSQAIELALAIGPERTDTRVPVIVGGDVNSLEHEIAFRALRTRANLRVASDGAGIDTVLYRDGSERVFFVRDRRWLFQDPVALDDGTVQRMSDHRGLLVELAVETCDGCLAPASVGADWPLVAREALAFTRGSFAESEWQMWLGRFAGPAILLALVLWRLRGKVRRRWLVAPTVLFVVAALWLIHLGFLHGPIEMDGIGTTLAKLRAAVVATTPAHGATSSLR